MPWSPRVCARAAGKPTRAVQSGLRVTKSRARLRPAPDQRTDPRTHGPSGFLTKFESSLPGEGGDARCAAALSVPGWARRRERGRSPPVRASRRASSHRARSSRARTWLRVEAAISGKKGYPSPQPQPGGDRPRSREGTGLAGLWPARNPRPRRAVTTDYQTAQLVRCGAEKLKRPRASVDGRGGGGAMWWPRLPPGVTACDCVAVRAIRVPEVPRPWGGYG